MALRVVPEGGDSFVNFDRRIFVQLSAEFAEGVADHLFDSGFHLVVLFPPEKFVVQTVVFVNSIQITRQLLRSELQGVDVGMRRCQFAVISAAVNHWNDVVCQNVEKLFCDVIIAQRILERQVKFVFSLQVIVTLLIGDPVLVTRAAKIS